MHELPWITIFCYSWGDLPMIFTSDEVYKSPHEWPKIVIHGKQCIILFRTSYFMSWTHHSATNTHCSLISLLTLRTVNSDFTHWGRVTHICVSKSNTICSDNGLAPGRRQAIIWTNTGILLIGPLGTNFIEILIEILTFPSRKCGWECRLWNGGHFVSATMC